MKELDYENWPRKNAYEFFSNISNPFYMISFRQDVTNLVRYAKKNELSFYYALIWLCTKAINDVEAFCIAVKDDKLVILDHRDPSFTDLKKDTEQFHIVTLEMADDLHEFCHRAMKLSSAQESFIDMDKESDELIYFSCLPWIDLTALTNERDLTDVHSRDDSIPHIAWGKYTETDGRLSLVISLEVNHRFIDGLHIGRFHERLEYYIESLG